MKHYFLILTFCSISVLSFGQKRAKTGNSYLDKKTRPSEEQRKKDAEVVARGNRAYEAQLDNAEKKLYPGRKKIARGGIGKTKKVRGKRKGRWQL